MVPGRIAAHDHVTAAARRVIPQFSASPWPHPARGVAPSGSGVVPPCRPASSVCVNGTMHMHLHAAGGVFRTGRTTRACSRARRPVFSSWHWCSPSWEPALSSRPPRRRPRRRPARRGRSISAESSPFGTVLMVGSGQFTGYSLYAFDLNTPSACTTKVVMVGTMPLSCAGPRRTSRPTGRCSPAGEARRRTRGQQAPPRRGRAQGHRGGAGHLRREAALPVRYGTTPVHRGEFRRDGAPAPPWHGYWYLVSAKDGKPASGPIAVTTQTIPNGPIVLAADMFQGTGATLIVVYTYSKDTRVTAPARGPVP